MNIRDLRYIVAVAELKSFSKAADYCYVSQPTLSHQIKKMEETLGVALFERQKRHVHLTEPGARIVAVAKQILAAVSHIENIAADTKDPSAGTLTLGAFPTLAPYFFPQIIPLMKEAFPKLKLTLVDAKTDQLIDKLKNAEIDAAFLALPVTEPSYDVQPLFDDLFYLAVPRGHPLAATPKIATNQLQGERLMLLEEGHCLRDQALDVCQITGLFEQHDFRATSLETLRQMVRAGSGVTLMPEIARMKDETDISYIPFTAPQPSRTIALVWRKTTTKREIFTTFSQILIQKKPWQTS